MLISECGSTKTLWEQINQVRAFQERQLKYIELYHNMNNQSLETNQFLDEQPNAEIDMQVIFLDKSQIRQNGQVYEHQKQSKLTAAAELSQSHHIQLGDNIRLSRIFQQIQLGDEILQTKYSNSLHIDVMLNSRKLHVELPRKDIYNLSNFSSFNNNKSKEDIVQYQFKDLLEKIQEKVGRTLSAQGIQNIVEQIAENLSAVKLEQQRKIVQFQSQTCKDIHNVFQTKLNELNLNHGDQRNISHFDSKLNNKSIQKRNATSKTKNNQTCGKTLVSEFQKNLKAQSLLEAREQQKKKRQKSIIQRRGQRKYQNKQNSQSLPKQIKSREAKENQPMKELKIIRKNNQKGALTMLYGQLKHVQNFCIVNKIYGKQKQKIIKAVQANKFLLNLQ